jgi:ribonucleotide reductase beta subunit family protein with ferritin-like domain
MFSASFAIIFYFKSRMLLPGVIAANELIAADEGFHQEYGVLIHKYINNKASAARIKEIIQDAVAIEKDFIDDAMPEQIRDLSAARIKQYVEYVADRLAVQLGCKKIYEVENPCAYMVGLGIDTKQNFFEVDGTAYLMPSILDKSLKEVDSY